MPVGPIYSFNMGAPQSKVETKDTIINNIDNKNIFNLVPKYIATLVIIIIVLYIAYRINKYFKDYIGKKEQETTCDKV